MGSLDIIHVDMDAFFAAVEQRDNPELRGKPVVVGGDPRSRGVVSTASYEARRYGISSAMPLSEAARRCPEAVFLPVRMGRYVEESRRFRRILEEYSDLVEPISLDEAFLDVSGRDAVATAREIKRRIREEMGLTASVGVSYNMFLAKLASDMQKPDGLTVIREEDVPRLLPPLPVRRLWGIGPKTETALRAIGVSTVRDLLEADRGELRGVFGRRMGEVLDLARGIDHRRVTPEQEMKSLSEETTFSRDTHDARILRGALEGFASRLEKRLRVAGVVARTVTLKLRYADFRTITRSTTLPEPISSAEDIYLSALHLFDKVSLEKKARLIGLGVSGLIEPGEMRQQRFELTE